MAKDPAILFYSNDFDAATKFFTHEQVGKYLRLLIAQHQHGRLSEQQMNFICGSYDKEVYVKFKKDENGLFYNERLENEIIRRSKFSESRSENRKGKTKKGKKKVHSKNTSKTYEISSDIHMETETETENRIETSTEIGLKNEGAGEKQKPEIKNPFQEQVKLGWPAWKDYRRQIKKPILPVSEQKALDELYRLSGGIVDLANQIISQSIANGWQGLFAIKPGQANGARPQTENQRLRDLVNNNSNLIPEPERYVEVPDPAGGFTMTGKLALSDDGMIKFIKAGRTRLTIDPTEGFKPSAIYNLAPGQTIEKIYESLLAEKQSRKSA